MTPLIGGRTTPAPVNRTYYGLNRTFYLLGMWSWAYESEH
jgi:hypothetical protein